MKLIKRLIKKIIPQPIINVPPTPDLTAELINSQINQRQLFFFYQNARNTFTVLPNFSDTGFRVFSQNDEDGLLVYIFALIGFSNKKLVDIAFATPHGSNSANLICNWNFHGLLIEANETKSAHHFFTNHKDTFIYPPKIIKKWITIDNVNEILIENNFEDEIDLLLLDIDGVDYWIWKNINAIKPRVVVVEYQDILGEEKCVTVPYSPDFNRSNYHEDFFGASLAAFAKLAHEKGYRLVGVNKYGFNAFFIKNGIGEKFLPEIDYRKCFYHPKVKDGMVNRFPHIKNMPWVEV